MSTAISTLQSLARTRSANIANGSIDAFTEKPFIAEVTNGINRARSFVSFATTQDVAFRLFLPDTPLIDPRFPNQPSRRVGVVKLIYDIYDARNVVGTGGPALAHGTWEQTFVYDLSFQPDRLRPTFMDDIVIENRDLNGDGNDDDVDPGEGGVDEDSPARETGTVIRQISNATTIDDLRIVIDVPPNNARYVVGTIEAIYTSVTPQIQSLVGFGLKPASISDVTFGDNDTDNDGIVDANDPIINV